jgi:hypothetical protein
MAVNSSHDAPPVVRQIERYRFHSPAYLKQPPDVERQRDQPKSPALRWEEWTLVRLEDLA